MLLFPRFQDASCISHEFTWKKMNAHSLSSREMADTELNVMIYSSYQRSHYLKLKFIKPMYPLMSFNVHMSGLFFRKLTAARFHTLVISVSYTLILHASCFPLMLRDRNADIIATRHCVAHKYGKKRGALLMRNGRIKWLKLDRDAGASIQVFRTWSLNSWIHICGIPWNIEYIADICYQHKSLAANRKSRL